MCAIPDKKALKELRSRKGTLRGWKVLARDAGKLRAVLHFEYTYVAGENRPQGKRLRVGGYNQDKPRGLHLYRSHYAAQKDCDGDPSLAIVSVTYKPEDVIAADATGVWGGRQVVVRKLRISQRTYDKAVKS